MPLPASQATTPYIHKDNCVEWLAKTTGLLLSYF